eukprot:TRINITY_DN101341_c0_g1_i1.p1 TRINITY_DN101341_c0_g1~~TRINITY_DN101341_c0_g1_i1.p1  ORF type:complete len:708 (+),score=129.82 TRINITY_DN101341_c0_g1_i1:89-2212(+)
MESEKAAKQNVSMPLCDYNQLYELAYLNERKAELDNQKKELEIAITKQDEAFKQKQRSLEEASSRREKERRGALTSQNWLMTSHAVEGTYAPKPSGEDSNGFAVFSFDLEFRIFEDEWTVIPLIDSQVISDAWSVRRMGSGDASWTPVSLASDALMSMQELDGAPSRQVFATSMAGLYRVTFDVYICVHCSRSLFSLTLNLLHPLTTAKFSLKRGSLNAMQEFNITPTSQYSVQESEEFLEVTMRLPLTKTVEICWRGDTGASGAASGGEYSEWQEAGGGKAPVEEEPLQITAEHQAMHSILDGVLQTSHTLKYRVDSEQRALRSVRISVPHAARVTSVAGHGVLSWRALPPGSSGCEGEDAMTMIEVSFTKSLLSDSIIVLVNTEMEVGEQCFKLPSLVCDGVLRQTGSLGVVKLANVEVHEKGTKGVARVGVDELPEELKYLTNRAIMFAYTYLSPQAEVQLQVVKHEQVGVLEAVAESAFYEVLVSESQSMHRLMLSMTNSNKQYLEVSGIPADARLWSLVVNSKPAKPVKGTDGSLLIPLLVGMSGKGNAGAARTSVEVAYLVPRASMGDEGSLDLAPPRLDVPVSKLLAEVQWPETHDVQYKTSAQGVGRFSEAVPKPVNHDVGSDIVQSGFDFNRAPPQIPKAGVNVQVPRAGTCRKFEQLLVVDGGVTLAATYKAKAVEQPNKSRGIFSSFFARFCAHRR